MIEVKTRRDGDGTYVLCRSEQRIPKDLAIRTRQEARLRADIDKLTARIANGRLVNIVTPSAAPKRTSSSVCSPTIC